MHKARHAAARNDRKGSLCRIIALAIAVVAAVHFALFGYFLFRTAIGSPISDMFSYIDAYLQYRAGQTSLLDYLWHAHGEHHLVWIRLLTWVDVEIFHTRGIPFMIAATAAMSATAALVWQQLRRAEPVLGSATSLGLLAPMLVLGSANVTDCSVPINTTYPLSVFFAIVALSLFADGLGPDPNTRFRRMAAVPAAFCASLATAAGLLAWPVLLWIAWRERLARTWLGVLAGISVIYAVIYAQDLNLIGLAPALQKDATAFLDPAHLRKLLDYFVAFLGLPLTRAPPLATIGRVFGAMLFLAGLAAVLIATFSDRLSGRLDRIAIGMILLAFGSAALAAIGRADLADEGAVPVRYALFATLLQVGLLCLMLPRLAQHYASPRSRLLLSLAGLLFAVVLLVQQIFVGRTAAQIANAVSREADCFAAGALPAGSVGKVVSRTPEGAQAVLTALRREGLLAPRSSNCQAP